MEKATKEISDPEIRHVLPPSKDNLIGLDCADGLARKEEMAQAKNINMGRRTRAHDRAEQLRDMYGSGLNWIVRIMVLVLIMAIVIVAWHYLAPERLRWLAEDDLSDLLSFLFSGAVISAVSLHIQRNL